MTPWLMETLAVFTAVMTALTIAGTIGSRFLGLVVKTQVQEANAEQTKMLATSYVPSAQSHITGAEIQRTFEEILKAIAKVQSDMADTDISRRRHEADNLKMIQLLATEVAVMKAVAIPRVQP
jgi:hypothetical protein